jgi:ATP-dependent DNA ligase
MLSAPIAPMLAKLSRQLPIASDLTYEPKWDGFRCLAFRDGESVELWSRNDRPLSRYFPELAAAIRQLHDRRVVVDGEILVSAGGRFDFSALMNRLHPAASRVEHLRVETPATYVIFDLLWRDERDLRALPFSTRRAELEEVMDGATAPLVLTPTSSDPAVAEDWLARSTVPGIDGVVVKPADLRYEAGRRAMVKVKRDRTADCVVAGFRFQPTAPVVASLLLGVFGPGNELRHVGVASSFRSARRAELVAELAPFVIDLATHPWCAGYGLEGGPVGRLMGVAGRWTPERELDWVPLRPELVCEVAYDQVEAGRFRYPARFLRWRPDRDPASCRLEQFDSDDRLVP